MIDGPGPPATCLVTVWVVPLRVAWIRSGVNAPWFTRETQRILLLTFAQRGCVQRIVIGPENSDDIPAVTHDVRHGLCRRLESGPCPGGELARGY